MTSAQVLVLLAINPIVTNIQDKFRQLHTLLYSLILDHEIDVVCYNLNAHRRQEPHATQSYQMFRFLMIC